MSTPWLPFSSDSFIHAVETLFIGTREELVGHGHLRAHKDGRRGRKDQDRNAGPQPDQLQQIWLSGAQPPGACLPSPRPKKCFFDRQPRAALSISKSLSVFVLLTSSLRLRQAFGVLAQHRREVLERRQELSGKLGVRAAEARTLSTGSFASRPNSRPLSFVVLLTRCCALLSLPDSPAGGQIFLRGSKRCC